jgi:hypothetical protein
VARVGGGHSERGAGSGERGAGRGGSGTLTLTLSDSLSNSGALSFPIGRRVAERERKRAAQLIPARRRRAERGRAGTRTRRPTDPRKTATAERERERAAQLIPARRWPQATHGTYRGESRGPGGCPRPRVGRPWPSGTPRARGGAVPPRSGGTPLPRGQPGVRPHPTETPVAPPAPHAAASGKKTRRPTDPRKTGAAGHPRYL